MRITTLVDNLVYSKNLLAEHGLSFYIEIEEEANHRVLKREDNVAWDGKGNIALGKAGNKILFDCGQSSIFALNAHNLGIDLKEVDTVVISHGHYDHTGGLAKFLEINKTAKIYIREEALLEKQNNGRYIGMPIGLFNAYSVSELSTNKKLTIDSKIKMGQGLIINPERVVFPTEQITQISESLYLATFSNKENPAISQSKESKTNHTKTDSANSNNTATNNRAKTTSAYRNIQTGFTVLQNGKHFKDCFNDEHYLIYKNNSKILVVTGCSHRGTLKIVALVEELFNLPVCEIIGGLHTQKQSVEEIESLAQELNKSSVQNLWINHCTGVDAFAVLKKNLRAKVSYNYTGNYFKSII